MIKLLFPVKFIGITQGFGSGHVGIDLGWNSNNGGPNHDILAPGDGKVVDLRTDYNRTDSSGKSYGNFIQLDHGNGVNTLHAHLKYGSAKVKKGDTVKAGQVIAKMGNTGHSTGTHLHYEVRINGTKKNPLDYTYATKDYVVSTSTKSKYTIKYLVNITSTVLRDTKKDQLKVLISDLNVRTEASTKGTSLGYAKKGGIYNILETKKDTNYTWYKISDAQWVANNGVYIQILLKEEGNDKSCEELHKQVEELNKTIKSLEKEIEELKGNNEIAFTYFSDKTAYYKIKLYENETLLIKR